MKKILLIKTGAAGDVVRTSVLLNVLPGHITWVIDSRYQGLLPDQHPHLEKVIPVEKAQVIIKEEEYDLVISLEEDDQCARLATQTRAEKLTGVYISNGQLTYTADSAGWFDMSLLSNQGKEAANELKLRNRESFQHYLFQMLGLTFRGEPYCIYNSRSIMPVKKLAGIEKRAGLRWPNKAWGGYEALARKLEQDGYTVIFFTEKKNIRDYLQELAGCSIVITGDTLAMHIALAYRIPAVAIFNCTSPDEIYDYGCLQKIINPLLPQSFYTTTLSAAVINAVTVEDVYTAVIQHPAVNKPSQKV